MLIDSIHSYLQQIVNRCKDILKKEKEARDADAAREAQARTLREEQLNGGQHGPSITTTTSVENTNITPAVAIATPVSSSSSSSSSSSTAIHNIVDAPIAQPITSSGDAGVASELVDPFQVLSVSREASTNSSDGKEFDRREKIIMDMMEQTKLEQDVCVFYLESTEWDLEKALEFVKSMS